jgi:hypothetical protein
MASREENQKEVLAAYGATMRQVQAFESGMKTVLGLYRMHRHHRPGLTDEEFEDILTGGGNTLGKIINEIQDQLKPTAPLPTVATEFLKGVVKIRNLLAHRYLMERGPLLCEESAKPYLLAELAWYEEIYATFLPRIERWENMLLDSLGVTKEFIAEVDIPDLRHAFREQAFRTLETLAKDMGLDLPTPPVPPPGPPPA